MLREQFLIDAIKAGKLETLDGIYLEHKKPFFLFAYKLGLKEDEVEDMYQDVILSFYQNVKSGRLNKLNCSLRTYLFSIGKFKIYKHLKKVPRITINDKHIFYSEELKHFETDLQEERTEQIKASWDKLGERCQQVLNYFYYQSYSLDEIVKHLNYSSKDVLKSQKSRCLKKLKELICKPNE